MLRKLFLIALIIPVTVVFSQDSIENIQKLKPLPARADSSVAVHDSIPAVKTRADTVLIAKHQFNHREQIITGSVIMACLIGMLAFMNNYNPR